VGPAMSTIRPTAVTISDIPTPSTADSTRERVRDTQSLAPSRATQSQPQVLETGTQPTAIPSVSDWPGQLTASTHNPSVAEPASAAGRGPGHPTWDMGITSHAGGDPGFGTSHQPGNNNVTFNTLASTAEIAAGSRGPARLRENRRAASSVTTTRSTRTRDFESMETQGGGLHYDHFPDYNSDT
jgi:hypothetical protein